MENLELIKQNATSTTTTSDKSKKERDREAILAMAGRYHVTFDFAETFSPIEGYKREELYKNQSIEYIFPIKEEENHISLQHILVINDSFVVKHWRQDWIFENQELLTFKEGQTWVKKTLTKEEVAGTWTQKVYQVDDCPRYQGLGTWVFVDGKTYWESNADAPLPRRQETRNDYNVLNRSHRIEITNYGWLMDQDNKKIFRTEDGTDKLVVWEKGFEVQNRGDYNCQPAIDYWEQNGNLWADIRNVWDEYIQNNDIVSFNEEVEGKKMYEYVFELVRKMGGENYKQDIVIKSIQDIIKSFAK